MFDLFGASQRDTQISAHCTTVGIGLAITNVLLGKDVIDKKETMITAQRLIGVTRDFTEMYSIYEGFSSFTEKYPHRKSNIDKWRAGEEKEAMHVPPPSEIKGLKEKFGDYYKNFTSAFPKEFFDPLKEAVDSGYEAYMSWVGDDEEKLEADCQKHKLTTSLFSDLFGHRW